MLPPKGLLCVIHDECYMIRIAIAARVELLSASGPGKSETISSSSRAGEEEGGSGASKDSEFQAKPRHIFRDAWGRSGEL
jgi:hypothetical protein